MRILHIIPYMGNLGGGPPVVVDRFSRELSKLGHSVSVLTTNALSDKSLSETETPYRMRIVHSRSPKVYAASRSLNAAAREEIEKADIVHLHTLWSFCTVITSRQCAALKKPWVISPHGMLDPNSLARKACKKKLYGNLVEFPRLRRATGMIYTHPKEQSLAESVVDGLPQGSIVPLGADGCDEAVREEEKRLFLEKYPELNGKQLVLFLGRVDPKKAPDLLIRGFSKVSPLHDRAHLVIVGNANPEYVAHLKQLASELGISNRTTFTGPLFGDSKWGAFASSCVFALPSHQENFAIAVVEAVKQGLKAVVSKNVNIWEEVVNAEVGFACEMTPESVSKCIQAALDHPSTERIPSERLAFLSDFSWQNGAKTLNEVYLRTLSP